MSPVNNIIFPPSPFGESTFTLGQTALALGWDERTMREFLYRRKVLRKRGLPLQRFIPHYFVIHEFEVTETPDLPFKVRYTGVTPDGIALIRRVRDGADVNARGDDGEIRVMADQLIPTRLPYAA
ncbi:hypothetical protein PAECIP111892_01785 [Paenibacillus auburnensis]|uniref:Uncharacterized protein n=1 Tax=Paenibacillus auburnensis TaxID=2905649 RepID=A0ABN8FY23_9BACL|nr:hypothetical protein [Paenibacillus auburnensis]CAH1194651.1 hypothetical protein PAECIP111892_01785 [Paenibacillus auburnensis]